MTISCGRHRAALESDDGACHSAGQSERLLQYGTWTWNAPRHRRPLWAQHRASLLRVWENHLRQACCEIPSLSPQSAFQGRQGSSAPSLQDSMVSESWVRFQNREDDTISHGVPFRSLVKLTSPHESYTSYSFQKGKDPEVATLYSAASARCRII